MENIKDYRKSRFIINDIIRDRESIVNSWIQKDGIDGIFKNYDLTSTFFIQHFGYKIVDDIVSIIKGEKFVDCTPIMYVFKIFYRKKGITPNDLAFICDELKLVYEDMYGDSVALEISSIIEEKFAVSLDYIDEYEMKNLMIVDANLSADKDRLRDIRFSTVHDLSSDGLAELLDDKDLDKIEIFQENISSLISLISSIEDADVTTISSNLPKIVNEYKIFARVLADIALFPILVRAFDSLVAFLNELGVEQLEDDSKRLLLMMMLGGLGHDLSSWIKTVFVDKVAEDIYYFDASFSNNCLEIELLFNQDESNNNQSNEEMIDASMMDEDDMMFFCP